jgi:hypothetical protein
MVSKFLIFLFPLVLLARPIYQQPWGKDADLKPAAPPKEAPHYSLGTRIAESIIDFHQKIISPVDGPRSSYRPTSSQYMRLAMRRYGFLKGYLMGCDRLLRENDEKWVYRTIEIDGVLYKYDPALTDKYGSIK